jgi:M6 family metalloprotease-like protein
MLSGAYVRFHPVSLSQPDGLKLDLYASGDEYYNWLHDKDGYTVKQNDEGWYVFMDLDPRGDLAFTRYVVGKDDPAQANLRPWTNISPERMSAIRNRVQAGMRDIGSGRAPTTGILNNIAVFIRFSDQTEFGQAISTYSSMFNGTTGNTMQSYFREASYNALDITTSYFPAPTTTVVSWQDSHPRAYYSPYSATNTIGYSGDAERTDREFSLLVNAVNGISSEVPAGLNLDGDNDGRVDNVCFIIKGNSDGWAELLWPHRWAIYDRYVYINGKRVYDFNFQLSDFLASSGVGVLCHEMFHTLGAPDLYHYSYDGLSPAGPWDLMDNDGNPPQHMGAYMKYRYGHWISSIPELTADGTYELHPLASATNNCYKIASPNSTSEYFVVEYRQDSGTFESSLPGSGLLVYRINTAVGEGNADGPPDEVYIYRPNGTTTANGSIYSAHYSQETGRTAINATTNPTPFLSSGAQGGLEISQIGSAGATISFVLGNPIPGAPSCTIVSPANGAIFDLNSLVTVEVTAEDADGSIVGVSFYLNDVLQYTDPASPYSWVWDSAGYGGGLYTIKVVATDNEGLEAVRSITVLLLAPAEEGFETGDLTLFPWVNASSVPWAVQSGEAYSGSYAARSGAIGDNASTSLSLTLNVVSPGYIIFSRKVSSESGWDFLTFYLDGAQQGQWSGSTDWAIESYQVPTGLRTFTWTYSKDTNTSAGSDCAWLDHIIFPPHGEYYAPPQNFSASAGNGYVDLSWQAPASGTPIAYGLYRDGTLLATLTGLAYHDPDVENGVTYGYYLTAVYGGGVSDPTPTVYATPSELAYVILGTGTTVPSSNTLNPINNTYRSIHGQSVYTAAELNAAGIYGPALITRFGFYPVSAPNLALVNFVVRMKHTGAANAANWVSATDLQTVYSSDAYMPATGGYDMLDLSSPFLWNGTDNILIDTAFGMIASYSQSGTLQTTSLTSGYIRVGNDSTNQTGVFTGGGVRNWRPNVRLGLAALELAQPVIGQITPSVTGTSLQWGSVPYAGEYQVYRAAEPDGAFTLIAATSSTQYTDPETLPRAFYYVKAVR